MNTRNIERYLEYLNEGFFRPTFKAYCYILEYKKDGFSYLLVFTKDENLQNLNEITDIFVFTKENFQELLNKISPTTNILNPVVVVRAGTIAGKFGPKVKKSIPNCKILDKSIVNYSYIRFIGGITITKFLGSNIFGESGKIELLQLKFPFFQIMLSGNKRDREKIKSNAQKYLGETTSLGFLGLILENLAITLTLMFLYIGFLIITTNRKKLFEKKLLKITGKNYIVRELNDDNTPNAFCFGGFGKSIIYTKKLKEILNERELISVFLHEIGHITSYDIIKGMLADIGVSTIFHYLIKYLFKNLIFSSISTITISSILISHLQKAPTILLGKWMEYKADEYTVKYGYAKDLISSLEKIEKWIVNEKRKVMGTPTKFEKAMDTINQIIDVHPSTENRIKKLFSKNELYQNLISKNMKKVKEIIQKTIMYDK